MSAGPPQALLLLARATEVEDEALAEALAGAGLAGSCAWLLGSEALPALAHAGARDPALADLLVTLAPEAVPALLARLAGAIALARSSVLVVRRHAILPGHDAIRLFFGLRRLPTLSHAQFCDYWLNHHAQIGRRLIPPYTYHQLHGQPEATAALAAQTGLPAASLDGVVEVHFPDLAALIAQLSRPEVAEEALADERNFIDHARSLFWAYREGAASS